MSLPSHQHGFSLLVLALLLALGSGGCGRLTQGQDASPAGGQTPADASPAPSRQEPITDRVVYVGNDYAIYSVRADGAGRERLTAGEGQVTWPTLSPDGDKLVFSALSQVNPSSGDGLYVADATGKVLARLFSDGPGLGPAIGPRIPHHAVWSPNGSHVAFLASSGRDVSLYLAPDGGLGEPRLITSGSPLYMAWSTDSKSLLIHRGAQLLRLDVEAPDQLLDLEASSRAYRTPAWAGGDGAVAFLVADGDTQTLYAAWPENADARAIAQVNGQASFLWAPTGDTLAVGESQDADDPVAKEVRLVDAKTGAARSLIRYPVLAFFWSPDGGRIAYVTTVDQGDAFQWRVVDVATSQDTELAAFIPSPDQLTWFAFFDQYAHSHQLWSPDGRYLLFAGALSNDPAVLDGASVAAKVYLLDTAGGLPPRAIADGLLASWSWR